MLNFWGALKFIFQLSTATILVPTYPKGKQKAHIIEHFKKRFEKLIISWY